MGSQLCPNCKRGALVSKGKRKKRCTFCGYIKYKSPHGRGRDLPMKTTDNPEMGIAKESQEPVMHSPGLPKGGDYQSKEYLEMRYGREQYLRNLRRQQSIQKQLEKLRKQKYSKIKRILIEGELWDVETGQRISEKEKAKKRDEDESSPDRIIEDMVFKES